MTVEQNKIPDWAKRERQRDMEWIKENLHIFWPAATDAYVQAGRGEIIVDTTQQPVEGLGNPFGYFPQSFVEQRDIEDIKRMVRDYKKLCLSNGVEKRNTGGETWKRGYRNIRIYAIT